MPEDTNPTFQIPRDVIEPIIKSHISTAILSALGGQAALMTEAVRAVLTMKVGSDGNPDRYSSREAKTLTEYLMSKAITEAAREAITEAIAEHKDRIKKEIANQLTKKNSPLIRQLAEGLVGQISNETALKWRLAVTCEEN